LRIISRASNINSCFEWTNLEKNTVKQDSNFNNQLTSEFLARNMHAIIWTFIMHCIEVVIAHFTLSFNRRFVIILEIFFWRVVIIHEFTKEIRWLNRCSLFFIRMYIRRQANSLEIGIFSPFFVTSCQLAFFIA
jgi:hypothetical protein